MESQRRQLQSPALRALGVLLPLVALGFVVERLWSARLQVFGKIDAGQASIIVILGSIVYAIDNLLLVLAWRHLYSWLSSTQTDWRTALRIYGRTQIAKYIPGNVFHLPSRHIMGRQAGLQHRPLLGAALLEIVGLLVASISISLVGFLAGNTQTAPFIAVVIALLAIASLPMVLRMVLPHVCVLDVIGSTHRGIADLYRGILPTWLMYLAFFLMAGGILYGIAVATNSSSSGVALWVVIPVYAVSWMTGTLAPGAPAGAGVREAVFVLALSGSLGEPESLLIALLSRLVTVLGDIYFYVLAQLIR